MPGVLKEGTPLVSTEVQIQPACLRKAGCSSKHKICKIVSAQIATKAVIAVRLIAISHGHVNMRPFAANLDLIFALDEADDFTIGNLAAVPRSRGGLISYDELARYIDVERC